jgi:steroid 5-alpha reductase family enzyme
MEEFRIVLQLYAWIGLTVLLLMTLLERTLKETKPGYREYMHSTSAFIPRLPR